jgi:hypothetical protein
MIIMDWYWIVADDQANVWSSARAMPVPVSDPAYTAWAQNNVPYTVASMDELYQIFATQFPAGSLPTYTTHVRTKTSGGGITVNGLPFATDVITLGSLNSAYIYTQAKTGDTFSWKLPDGSWVTLDKADIAALQNAVSKFGQDCFDCEAATLDAIDAGTITDLAGIDAAFAAIPKTFTGVATVGQNMRRKK